MKNKLSKMIYTTLALGVLAMPSVRQLRQSKNLAWHGCSYSSAGREPRTENAGQRNGKNRIGA